MNRKLWSNEEKVSIVLEIIRGDESAASICNRHGVSATQAYKWLIIDLLVWKLLSVIRILLSVYWHAKFIERRQAVGLTSGKWLVYSLLGKQDVEGSNPFTRFFTKKTSALILIYP